MRIVLYLLFICAICGGFSTAFAQPEPQRALYLSGTHTLQGTVFKPQGAGPFPAVVFNQGYLNSKKDTTQVYSALAKLFTSRGYVFFLPGRHEPIGAASDETLSKDAKLIQTHEHHGANIVAAITWLKAQVYVDEQRVVVIGESAGAVSSLFARESDMGIRGMVLFAPGTQALRDSKPVRERLKLIVQTAKVPIFLIQVENDTNLLPREILGAELEQKSGANRVKVFPPYGDSLAQAQQFTVQGSPVWQRDVLTFIQQVTTN